MKPPVFAVVALIFLFLAQSAFSQATRTWVSGVGDDANPGSRTAPCKTLAGVIEKTAVGGEIDALDPGGFGALTITQAVTIDGGPGVASVLVAGTSAIVISTGSTTPIEVTLRNFDLNGIGSGTVGISVQSPVILHLENCRIFGFTGHAIDFEPGAASFLYLQNVEIRNCTGDGLFLKPGVASNISIENSRIKDCGVGVHGDVNSVTVVRGSSAVGNAGSGYETTAGATMTILSSDASFNGTGISAAGRVIISADTVTNNIGEGLLNVKGGQIESFHNNAVAENGSKKEGAPTSDLSVR